MGPAAWAGVVSSDWLPSASVSVVLTFNAPAGTRRTVPASSALSPLVTVMIVVAIGDAATSFTLPVAGLVTGSVGVVVGPAGVLPAGSVGGLVAGSVGALVTDWSGLGLC